LNGKLQESGILICVTYCISIYNGYQIIFRGKAAKVNHPTPSSTEVTERVELYLYSPSLSLAGYGVNFTFMFTVFPNKQRLGIGRRRRPCIFSLKSTLM
jgi:hypothetical protein